MTARPTVQLPDEVMVQIPSDRKAMLEFLAQYIDTEMLSSYEEDFQRRVGGVLGTPFARHELALLRDFSMYLLLGEDLKSKLEAAVVAA